MAKRQQRTSRRKADDAEDSLFTEHPNGGEGAPPPGAGDAPDGVEPPGESVVALREATRERYLNYALSVITSRALPDVRDGLKPVQRRILYTMHEQRITAEAKHRKCAKVVGDVMGNYHPHGDSAIYETLVRMAQPFSMRAPLIDGSGNFGSLDGDGAAAMRYTECRLQPIAAELLEELGQETVDFRPSYDGAKTEPIVLPARLPNLLLNGATGIAVGMATSIPPHNLSEVCRALVRLLDNPELRVSQLCSTIKGPDFPTGGRLLSSPEELRAIYQTGSGTVRLRGDWKPGPVSRSARTVYIESIPYLVNKAQLVERIGEVVLSRKLPPLVNVRDLSTDEIRIELELKRDADVDKVMAYLCRHTPLQTTFAVNLTCLIPTENPEVGRPERCDLRELLWNFLKFRLEVVTRRLDHELAALKKRIHILEGFELVFDALDEILEIIRGSDGKKDAAKKIIARFELDEAQTDAILELRLYRLARLEILVIREELASKRARVDEIESLLADESSRWSIVKGEIQQIEKTYGRQDKRRTLIDDAAEEPTFSEDDFIVAEDNTVIVTRDGWIKRQKDVADLGSTRLREGDAVLAAVRGSTRSSLVLFSDRGAAYTCRMIDVPASTGHGEPIQKRFKLGDGERIVQAVCLDPRSLAWRLGVSQSATGLEAEGEMPPAVHAIAGSSDGFALRFDLSPFAEPSTRNGRRYARPRGEARVVGLELMHDDPVLIAATRQARAILCRAEEVSFLAGAGRGVTLIKLGADDALLGFKLSYGDRDLLQVRTSRGAMQSISTAKYDLASRGGKGREILKRGQFSELMLDPPTAPRLPGEV